MLIRMKGREASYKSSSPDRYRLLREYARNNRRNATLAEQYLWEHLRGNVLGVDFLRQHVIGDYIADFVGPLGRPTNMEGLKRVCVVGGGVGNAIAYPVAKGMHDLGIEVDMVAGFRSKDIVILEDEMRAGVTNLYITTDDGSYGEAGFNVTKMKALLDAGNVYDEVMCVGPTRMMQRVCDATKEYGIKTIVSMNPIMLDGTGMCGACRVTVDGKVKFACVDGPEFDGHLVDFGGLRERQAMYRDQEAEGKDHICRIGLGRGA